MDYQMLFWIETSIVVILFVFSWRLWITLSATQTVVDEYRDLYESLQDNLFATLEQWRKYDALGSYETNDELQVFFKYIKASLTEIEQFFTEE